MPRSAYLPFAANGPDIGTGQANCKAPACANALRATSEPNVPGTADNAASFNIFRRFKMTLLRKETRTDRLRN